MFGIGEAHLSVGEMLLRLLVVFPLAVLMIRLGNKRFLGDLSTFDVVIAIMLGSILSRAITGNAPFVSSVAAGFGLVLLHRWAAALSLRSKLVASLFKGRKRLLVRDGEIQWQEMRQSGIGEGDLRSAMRRNAETESVEDVGEAYLERSGEISVIPRSAVRDEGPEEQTPDSSAPES